MKKFSLMFVMAMLLLAGSRIFAQSPQYVDLGLPSGTLWATCNLGADAPEQFGNSYAWGETATKAYGNWGNYKYCKDGDSKKLTKYCSKSDKGNKGFTDSLTVLKPSDDPARANWGSEWCVPTAEQWNELVDNTTSTWTTQKGEYGRLFKASNGKSLFLPGYGPHWEGSLFIEYVNVLYWSSSLKVNDPSSAWAFILGPDAYDVSYSDRSRTLSVRPVCSGTKEKLFLLRWWKRTRAK